MGKILPILLAVIGIGAGIGAGIALKPAPMEDVAENPCGDDPHQTTDHVEPMEPEEPENSDSEYVKLNNQFVVPVVEDDKVSSLVLVAISVEVAVGQKEAIFLREPKIRDAFLQVMFDHANLGGFSGAFTHSNNLDVLRGNLLEVAHKIMGSMITDVLITDINRQDV